MLLTRWKARFARCSTTACAALLITGLSATTAAAVNPPIAPYAPAAHTATPTISTTTTMTISQIYAPAANWNKPVPTGGCSYNGTPSLGAYKSGQTVPSAWDNFTAALKTQAQAHPNGLKVVFPAGCYYVDGSMRISGISNVVFEGTTGGAQAILQEVAAPDLLHTGGIITISSWGRKEEPPIHVTTANIQVDGFVVKGNAPVAGQYRKYVFTLPACVQDAPCWRFHQTNDHIFKDHSDGTVSPDQTTLTASTKAFNFDVDSQATIGLPVELTDATHTSIVPCWVDETSSSSSTLCTKFTDNSMGITVGGNMDELGDTSNVIISNNTVRDTWSDGIYTTGANHTQISGNTVTHTGRQGITVSDANGATVANNVVSDISMAVIDVEPNAAPWPYGALDVAVTDNTLDRGANGPNYGVSEPMIDGYRYTVWPSGFTPGVGRLVNVNMYDSTVADLTISGNHSSSPLNILLSGQNSLRSLGLTQHGYDAIENTVQNDIRRAAIIGNWTSAASSSISVQSGDDVWVADNQIRNAAALNQSPPAGTVSFGTSSCFSKAVGNTATSGGSSSDFGVTTENRNAAEPVGGQSTDQFLRRLSSDMGGTAGTPQDTVPFVQAMESALCTAGDSTALVRFFLNSGDATRSGSSFQARTNQALAIWQATLGASPTEANPPAGQYPTTGPNSANAKSYIGFDPGQSNPYGSPGSNALAEWFIVCSTTLGSQRLDDLDVSTTAGAQAFVGILYTNVFGTQIPSGQRDAAVQLLTSGTLTRAQYVTDFVGDLAPLYQPGYASVRAATAVATSIDAAYLVTFGRLPSVNELVWFRAVYASSPDLAALQSTIITWALSMPEYAQRPLSTPTVALGL